MSPSQESRRAQRAPSLTALSPKIKPDFTAVAVDASSVVLEPQYPQFHDIERLSKSNIKKLQHRANKLISKRGRLENAIEAERGILRDGCKSGATPSKSPVWSSNMEAMQAKMKRLGEREGKLMMDLAATLDFARDAYRNDKSKTKAVRKIHDQFGKHLSKTSAPHILFSRGDLALEVEADKDEVAVKSEMATENDSEADMTETTLQEQFEQVTRHMNLNEYDATKLSSDIDGALARSVVKPALTGTPFHSREAAAVQRLGVGSETDPFTDRSDNAAKKIKKQSKRERKRKRLAEETAAEQTDDEGESDMKQAMETKKSKKEKKLKNSHVEQELVEHQIVSANAGERDEAIKKKNRDKNQIVTPPTRRYSTSAIPVPIIPSPHRPAAQPSPSGQRMTPIGPPVPVKAPVAPNSGRRRSFTTPRVRLFSSIRTSPPPIMGPITTIRKPKKRSNLEGGSSSPRSKSSRAKGFTLSIGAYTPVRAERASSPTDAVSQKRSADRPKGSKTRNKKAASASEPKRISTTPVPLPAYARRARTQDLVRMVVPSASGRAVFANSPSRTNASLEERLQQDRAMHAEERARWFEAIGMQAPDARGFTRYM